MTNQELSAAIKDLDAQLEEWIAENTCELRWPGGLLYRKGTTLCFHCGTDFSKLHPMANIAPHMGGYCVSVSTKDGQAGGVQGATSAPANSGGASERFHRQPESTRESPGMGTTADKSVEYLWSEPERVYPTKWIAWLLVGFATFCAALLVAAWRAR